MLKQKGNLQHILIILLFLPIIFLFYWMLTFKIVVPVGDGMIPVSAYSYIYSSFINFGKIFLWNPFSLGGGEDLLTNYIFNGFSPLNPFIYLWLFISKLIQLKVYQSYYFYILLNIWLGTIFIYLLGYKYFFKIKASSIYLALVFAISGYFVSNTPIMNYMFPYAWLPICIYFGLNGIYENKTSNYLFFSFAIFIVILNYSTISVGILLYVILFLATVFVYKLKESNDLKKYIPNLIILVFSVILLNLGYLFTYLNYMKDGIKSAGDLSGFFLGLGPEYFNSNIDIQWIFNTYIPNTFLDLWGKYGNKGLWFNQFFYLGFASAVLSLVGVIYFAKEKRKFSYFFGLTVATIFALLYSQGHAVLHLIPQLNMSLKYPEFSRVLVVFSILVLSGFGFNFLFANSLKYLSNILLKCVFILLLVVSWVLALLIMLLFKNFGKGLNDYPTYLLYTFSYSLIIGLAYGISVILNKKWIFIGLLMFDLFFFLSRSYPYTGTDALRPFSYDFTSYHVNNDTSFNMPFTFNYSMSKKYPGMHFGLGPLLYRETAAVSGGFMPNRRLYFSQLMIGDIFKDKGNLYNMLQILGVTKRRYFFSDGALLVNNTNDILPKLKELYRTNSWHFANPVIIGKSENKSFNTSNIKIPDARNLKLYTDEDKYLEDANRPANWRQLDLKPDDFAVISSDKKQKVLFYKGQLPQNDSLITENSVMELICGELIDANGIYYYPVSNDIFNFTISESEYVVSYNNFYAIYPDSNGKLNLFIRLDNNKNTAFKYRYNDNCQTEFGREGKQIAKQKDIKIRTIKYLKGGTATQTIFSSYLSDIPSYFGEFVKRYSVTNLKTNQKVKWHSTNTDSESFSLNNNIFFIYKNFIDSPFIDSDYRIDYAFYQKDLYQGTGLTVIKDTPDEIIFNTSKKENSLLVIRNIFNRDWVATVDGKKADIYIINGLYMGATVPSGNHKVIFRYNPAITKIMMIINPLFLIFSFGVFLLEKQNRKAP